MMRNRRRLLLAAGGTGALGACSFSLEHGLLNPCRAQLPPELASDERVLAAWEGIDATRLWDCHAHLLGSGDSGGGIWLNPDMLDIANPVLFDFVLKRHLRAGDKRFPRSVFETRRFFDRQGSAASARLT